MTAVTQDLDTPRRQGGVWNIGLAATAVIYAGCLVNRNNAGDLIDGADAVDALFAGVARASADNADGDARDVDVDVYNEGEFLFALQGGSADEDDVGREVYVKDNATVGKLPDVTNRVRVGVITGIYSATQVWVRIEPLAPRHHEGQFTVRVVGPNAAAFDLSAAAALLGGSDFYVRQILHAKSFLTADGTLVDGLLVVTTDYTLSGGVLTAVGDQSARTWEINFIGTLTR